MARAPAHAHHSHLAAPGAGAEPRLAIAPDRVMCSQCRHDTVTASARRFRYAFAHCRECGPSYSQALRQPSRRADTAFGAFPPCPDCAIDYEDRGGRHFHLETVSCPRCGPQVKLIRFDGRPVRFEHHSLLDDVDAACSLIQRGEVIAIKGPGGWQLACDATNAAAIARLRRAKQNETRPLPLMARSLHVIARYGAISVEEEYQLTSPAGPLVVLRAAGEERLPGEIALGLGTLAFMLPPTSLHQLLLARMNRPVVMTSGNLSGMPQIIDDDEAAAMLGVAITYALTHNQPIINRIDDSVVRMVEGRPRLLRRGKGHAPRAMLLPDGFETATNLVGLGTERETAFCLVKDGLAIPSPHFGALTTRDVCLDYRDAICSYRRLLHHEMSAVAIDANAQDRAAKLARAYAAEWPIKVVEVQHQHAHVAACLAEHRYPLDAPPVLGIVLDGDGWHGDGLRRGCEFLLADYRGFERLAMLKPVALPDSVEAAHEPWRSLHAHVTAATGWFAFTAQNGALDLCRDLRAKAPRPLENEDGMQALADISSCARLLDAVAAALGLAGEGQAYEGEAAMRLEGIVDEDALRLAISEAVYPVLLQAAKPSDLAQIDPSGMWLALFSDLARKTPEGVIAARFHAWLASSVAAMAVSLAELQSRAGPRFTTVALSGCCVQNRYLMEEITRLLRRGNFMVLSPEHMPPHDGGIGLGQAVVAAARRLSRQGKGKGEGSPPDMSA